MAAKEQELTLDDIEVAARLAGLNLSVERREALAPQLRDMLARLGRLEGIDLAEVEPAFIVPPQED